MGLRAVYRRPRTTKPATEHGRFPYLLKGLSISAPDQVWAADITFIPMARGFLYLVAIMDWYSRYVLSWRLSNTLDAGFCVEALEEVLQKGPPHIFNTDQGGQFTDEAFTALLAHYGVSISVVRLVYHTHCPGDGNRAANGISFAPVEEMAGSRCR